MHNTEKANVRTGHLEVTAAESVDWFSSNMAIILGSLCLKNLTNIHLLIYFPMDAKIAQHISIECHVGCVAPL